MRPKLIPDLESLSLEQKVGQVLCMGWDEQGTETATTLNGHAIALVGDLQVGAIVLMGRNIVSPEQTRDIIAEMQARSPIPLLVAIDQEGGTVNRIHEPFHEFPGNMALGAIACGSDLAVAEELTRRQASAQARELRGIGINWNFAPVVDVNNNPDNPIIGVRSYGEAPKLVAALGAAAVCGYQDAGLMACAKHFPGHGDTAVDSHLALPAIEGDKARLNGVELVPFRSAISAGVGSIMTTHILFKALDAERPATLSPAILTGLLRKELGYDGLVITDCLEMRAVAHTIGTARGAVEALKAGADMALVCHTLETQKETHQAIVNAVKASELLESRLNEAVGRVLSAKRTYCSNPVEIGDKPWLNEEHATLETEIAGTSVTIVRSNGTVPLRPAANKGISLISTHPAGRHLEGIFSQDHQDVACLITHPELNDGDIFMATSLALRAANNGDYLLVMTAPAEPWTERRINQERQAEFVRMLLKIYGPKLVVIALKEPYVIRSFPQIENYICTYGYRPCSLEALADVLLGKARPVGRLPVSIPGVYELKRGTA
jgi:beta-N-acetylhexosaminidase